MHIICPHCTTSYAINPATLGAAGRTVRCSRCKETWLARPEDAIEMADAMPRRHAGIGAIGPAGRKRCRGRMGGAGARGRGTGRPGGRQPLDFGRLAGRGRRSHQAATATGRRPPGRMRRTTRKSRSPRTASGWPAFPAALPAPHPLHAVLWPADRLRRDGRADPGADDLARRRRAAAAADRDVLQDGRAGSEPARAGVQGHQDQPTRPWTASRSWSSKARSSARAEKPVELPRLRFSVRDAQGAEIYAWNAVLDQPVLKPGERAYFKSRLASPPPEGRNIDVRFFNKRDLAGHA